MPATVLKRENLAKVVNDASRKVTIRGKQTIVPLKFDEDGEIATPERLVIKRLSLSDLRFLKSWREKNWDLDAAISELSIDRPKAERLAKRLACFRNEDYKVKALASIPTPEWIAARHVENIYEGGNLEDSQHKSLQELAKIEGAYKQQAPSTQINVFNLPDLPPEQARQVKEVFDTIATKENDVAA